MTRALIVGTGLVGASIGMALTEAGEQVHLRDRVRSHAVAAAALGAGVVDPPEEEDVSLVVVAVPPEAVAEVVTEALTHYRLATVTDVSSVKAPIVAEVGNPMGVERYVPSHPMAGSQYSGPLTASGRLFVDRPWAITPTEASSSQDVDRVERLARICGARLLSMSPAEHDIAVARVSHLPHLMSVLTAGNLSEVPDAQLRLAGQGVRDVTRVAGSDTRLWRQILTSNSAAVRAELENVRADLGELLSVIGNPDELEAFLARGREGSLALRGKHGRPPEPVLAVVVEIPDEPRALARLFTDVADLGVNVEDVSIEHDQVRQVGYLAIQVREGSAARLSNEIAQRGWRLRPGL